jgi:hypothetical protein
MYLKNKRQCQALCRLDGVVYVCRLDGVAVGVVFSQARLVPRGLRPCLCVCVRVCMWVYVGIYECVWRGNAVCESHLKCAARCACFAPLSRLPLFVFCETWVEQGGEGGVLGQGNVDEIRTQGQDEEAYILKKSPSLPALSLILLFFFLYTRNTWY